MRSYLKTDQLLLPRELTLKFKHMEDKQKQYAGLVIEGLLRLKEGDALSVNCEEKDIEFARIVCNLAVEKTNVTVKLFFST